MTSRLRHLKDELARVDVELAKCRGPASERQVNLLRRRREILLEIRDQERAVFGD